MLETGDEYKNITIMGENSGKQGTQRRGGGEVVERGWRTPAAQTCSWGRIRAGKRSGRCKTTKWKRGYSRLCAHPPQLSTHHGISYSFEVLSKRLRTTGEKSNQIWCLSMSCRQSPAVLPCCRVYTVQYVQYCCVCVCRNEFDWMKETISIFYFCDVLFLGSVTRAGTVQ